MKQFLFLPCLLALVQLAAQPHSDCATALLICNKQTIHIDTLFGPGLDNTELNQATCFANGAPGNFEFNSCWIRFTAAQSGSLFLTITPDTTSDDLDFVLFQMSDTSNCQQKQVLRCMAAGGNTGGGPCMGPTGLMPGEVDTTEDAGCTDFGDNNFLAPVDLVAGETCVLCVQNFSTLRGFRIEFCGSALLGCETDICTALSAPQHPDQTTYQLHRIYPNPASATTITIDMEVDKAENLVFTLVNALGQPVRKIPRFLAEGRQAQEFPVNHLPPGAYWLKITNGKELITRLVYIGNTPD